MRKTVDFLSVVLLAGAAVAFSVGVRATINDRVFAANNLRCGGFLSDNDFKHAPRISTQPLASR